MSSEETESTDSTRKPDRSTSGKGSRRYEDRSDETEDLEAEDADREAARTQTGEYRQQAITEAGDQGEGEEAGDSDDEGEGQPDPLGRLSQSSDGTSSTSDGRSTSGGSTGSILTSYGGDSPMDPDALGNEAAGVGYLEALGQDPEIRLHINEEGQEIQTILDESAAESDRVTTNALEPGGRADRVDSDAFLDKMGAHALAGDTGINPDSVQVAEDGSLSVDGYEEMDFSVDGIDDLKSNLDGYVETGARIDAVRADDFDVTREDIANRAQEIATDVEESDQTDDVAKNAGRYNAKVGAAAYGLGMASDDTDLGPQYEEEIRRTMDSVAQDGV